jgi:hypothetical protein
MGHRMDYEQFVRLVEQGLAEELSDERAPWVATPTDAERFNVDEFVRRVADRFLKLVADRAGVRDDGAEPVTQAVLETLAEPIAGGEVKDLISSSAWRCTSRCGAAADAAAARQRGCRWTSSSRGGERTATPWSRPATTSAR